MSAGKAGALTRWLERAPSWLFASWAIAAAFSTYFCMYAFRKPFAAASYEGAKFFGTDDKPSHVSRSLHSEVTVAVATVAVAMAVAAGGIS